MTSTITLNQFPVATQANTGDTLYLSQSGIDKQVPVEVLLSSFIAFQNLIYSVIGAGQIGTSAGVSVQSMLSSLTVGQNAGVIGYTTLALLNADLLHPAGTIGIVTNDPVAANSTFYIKSGVSGSGVWTISNILINYAYLQALGTTGSIGQYPAPNGVYTFSAGTSIIEPIAATSSGTVTRLSAYTAISGPAIAFVATLNGDGTVTLVSSQSITLAAGANTVITALAIAAGQYAGVYMATAGLRYTTPSVGNNAWYTAGLPTTSTTKTVAASMLLSLGFFIESNLFLRTTNLETITSPLNSSGAQTFGSFPAVDGSNTYGVLNATLFNQVPITADGYISDISTYVAQATSAQIMVATISGGVATKTAALNVQLSAGLNTFSNLNIIAKAGQYVGLNTAMVAQRYNNVGGNVSWYAVGNIGSPAAVIATLGYAKFSFIAQYGVFNRVNNTESTLAAISLATAATSTAATEGYGLLAAADNTGVVDATSIFAAARAAHPYPYVPPGTYAVTALPTGGDGFWGPGDVLVNGVLYALPQSARQQGGYLLSARQKLASLASSGSPLVVIGDSLTAHFYASTLSKHWLNRLEDWLNQEYAPGSEPSVCNFDNVAPETGAFYGVTVTGGTLGTSGPVGKSIVLAAGNTLSITGNYAFVDVFYNQASGAGSLAFSFNGGAAYKTVSAAGTATTDLYTGPSATGQTTSGTYTITATGGTVEVTGLVRKAAKLSTAGLPNPINVMRVAHGGYTTGNFTGTPLQSAIKQANALATTSAVAPVYMVALLTNDALFGTTPRDTVFAANLTSIFTALNAAGAGRLIMVLPSRPLYSSWGSYYSTGQDFDLFVGIANKVCATFNAQVIHLDEIDFAGNGLLYADNLHWSDAGNEVVFKFIADKLANF